MTEDPFAAPTGGPPGGWQQADWAGPPGWPAPPRERAPVPVVVAAVLCFVLGVLSLAVGLFLVISIIGLLLSPLFLLPGALWLAGGAMVLRGGRAGVVLLTGLHVVLGGGALLLDLREGGAAEGRAVLPLVSVVVVVLLWLPVSQRWLWRRRPSERS